MLDPNKRLRKIITQTNNQLKEGEWIEFYKDVDGSPKWQKLPDKVLPTKVQRDKNGKVDVYVKAKVVPTNEQIEWTGTHPLQFKEKNFCIGFSREVGRVLIAFENEFPKHCLLECWVGTLLHYPDGNQYQHLAQLNAVSWAMSSKMKEDLRYVKKVEAISQKFPFVNGVVVKKSDENFYAWNWDYGLCTVPRSLFQDADVDLGSWLYFSPITLDKRTKEDLLQSVAIFVSVSESDIYETTIKGGQIYIKHTIEVPFQNHENSTRTYRINVIGRINDASSLVLSRHEGKKLEVISKCIFLEENQVNWIISSVNDNEEVSIPFQTPILQQPSKPKNMEPKDFYLFGSTSKEAKKFHKSACTSITGVIYGEYRSLFYVYSDAAILG
uniref:Uncharacterized protein n=1 Tax=Acrobeloides nanus TaxID=290746 RepID=A0A914E7F3_9BILA